MARKKADSGGGVDLNSMTPQERAEWVRQEVNRKLKGEALVYASQLPPKEFLPSGSISLDAALGGGWVRGEASMVWGPEGSGKSTLAAMTAAAVQRQGGVVVWIDAENRLDLTWLAKNGVDVDALIIIRPPERENPEEWNPFTAEQVLNQIIEILRIGANVADLIVLDSLAVLVPAREWEAAEGMDKKSFAGGGLSAILSQLQRMIMGSGLLKRSGAHLMFLNQVREKIGGYMPVQDFPGGHAVKHMVSQVVRVNKSGYKEKDYFDPLTGLKEKVKVGNEVTALVQKNSAGPPHKKARFTIMYDIGFDPTEELVTIAVNLGIIKQSGAWFSYVDPETGEVLQKWQGMGAVIDALDSDLALRERIEIQVRNEIKERGLI